MNKHDKCIQHYKTKHLNENQNIKILNQERYEYKNASNITLKA